MPQHVQSELHHAASVERVPLPPLQQLMAKQEEVWRLAEALVLVREEGYEITYKSKCMNIVADLKAEEKKALEEGCIAPPVLLSQKPVAYPEL